MRKFVIFLTILVFLACLGFGLYTSYKPEEKQNQVEGRFSATDPPPVSEYQSNYLIIHVDDMQSANPQLISVWGIIAYYPEPKLIFQPLYPMPTATNDQVLRQYKLSNQKIPDPSWLRALADYYQITWDNYILLDTQAMIGLGSTAYGGGIDFAVPDDPIGAEKPYMQAMCDSFSAQGRNFLMGFPWKDLIPDRFRTNVGLDFGLINMDKMLSPGLPVKCEF